MKHNVREPIQLVERFWWPQQRPLKIVNMIALKMLEHTDRPTSEEQYLLHLLHQPPPLSSDTSYVHWSSLPLAFSTSEGKNFCSITGPLLKPGPDYGPYDSADASTSTSVLGYFPCSLVLSRSGF